MELLNHKKLHVVAGRATQGLAADICHELGVTLGSPNIAEFANGEIHVKYGESIRGSDVFIVQTHTEWEGRSINDAIMEHLIMVDAAKRASAKRITAVIPFFGYGRQDRKASGREPISARLVADLFSVAGADRLVSVDLHSGQIQGFFDGPVDHLTAMPVLVDYLADLSDDDMVIVSPDAGRMKVAERYTNLLGADLAYVHKRRATTAKNSVEAKEIIGEVKGRTCVLIDDMIDTGGTICAAADLLDEYGARRVIVATTHGVFSGPAIDRLKNAAIETVLVTDTLPLPPEKQIDKMRVLSVAPIIARAISAVFEDTSVSDIFGGQHLA
ncbi:MAG: ribose-phosphate diphosphokinase [Actinobacteria bacterium]|nr:ribose-phosphate diphosphokinase [Actinomycetota bacterium]NIS37022.1 ribose-phosphate diphosphokinase [Actinomycetota bacterium]NIT99040.1 ribose-phosphate diphosphokinase [Actinomycetota bacterium]NIU22656.1 ribose-phosphate diphosphokinase [Actinomycetota bacterium]NIU71484.1 ribose-phosphate diphosphokinase [Actinomycetota bacterium]